MEDNITKFPSWAIRDSLEWKESYGETISWTAFKRYAQYMTEMKAKYWWGNFKKWIPISSYEDSLIRHYQKYMVNKYEWWQIELDKDHISAIIFNAFGILHEEEMQKLWLREEVKLENIDYQHFITT